MSLVGEPSAEETYDALETILGDEETFQTVVHTVFNGMDKNGNGSLEAKELGEYLGVVCGELGAEAPPTSSQVLHVFKHLDLNSDNCVSIDELEVFLRHLFTEQMYQAKERIAKAKAAAAGLDHKAAAAATPKDRCPKRAGYADTSVKRGSEAEAAAATPKVLSKKPAGLWAALGKTK